MRALDEFDKLLMLPGPTPVTSEILSALGQPTIAHTSAALAEIIRACLDGLKEVVGTTSASVFAFAGSGTLAQEAAVVNLVAPGERMLVISNGYFGDRFAAIAEAHRIVPERVQAARGSSVTADQLENRLRAGNVRAVTITHVDTSSGVEAPVAELAEVANRHDAFVIVDAVCALGGIPEDMDGRKIDVLLSGAQKALGVPPGLVILAVSERAMERRRSLDRVSTYYADLLNWEASMSDPRVYFSTHAVNLFYALLAALEIIQTEGLPARYSRHEEMARGFRVGMRALGFEPLTDSPYLAATLSVLGYPSAVDDERFRSALADRGVVCAGCLGELKGRGARFGHMGNMRRSDILRALQAVESALQDLGMSPPAGAAVAAAETAMAQEASVP